MSNQSFADLGVSRAVVSSLTEQGFTHPFAIQNDVIPDALAGRDVLAKSPTGSGKTLAFGIPIVDRTMADGPRPAALVLAPTRELATQIVGGHPRDRALTRAAGHRRLRRRRARQAGARTRPARTFSSRPPAASRISWRGARSPSSKVQMLVLDEADRMLDMGFRPAVHRIVEQCPTSRQTLFFSATLDGEAGSLATQYTHGAALHERGPSQRRASVDVEHRFIAVQHEDRLDTLVEELGRERELTLVFVRTKHGADRLVKRLRAHGIESVAMHGNKSQRQREQALASFESGAGRHARRDRRRRSRPRRERDLARHQLRSARPTARPMCTGSAARAAPEPRASA